MSAGRMISVIIPTLNAAAHVGACLESLRAQSYGGYEVIVVDAQSTDGTVEIARAQAAKAGGDFQIISEPDLGVYHAMNKGISHTRGEWLYFLGADDALYDANVFSDVVTFIAGRNLDIVYGDVLEKHSGARYAGEFSLDRLLFECNICHQAVFYRRSVFDRLGGYSTRYPFWADWEFNIRCFRHPQIRALWMDRMIAVYRELSGLSREQDPVFKKEFPVTLIRETAALREELTASMRETKIRREELAASIRETAEFREELAKITGARWYRWCSRLFRWFP